MTGKRDTDLFRAKNPFRWKEAATNFLKYIIYIYFDMLWVCAILLFWVSFTAFPFNVWLCSRFNISITLRSDESVLWTNTNVIPVWAHTRKWWRSKTNDNHRHALTNTGTEPKKHSTQAAEALTSNNYSNFFDCIVPVSVVSFNTWKSAQKRRHFDSLSESVSYRLYWNDSMAHKWTPCVYF